MTNMGATGDALYNCPSDLQVGNTSFHNFDSEALGPDNAARSTRGLL